MKLILENTENIKCLTEDVENGSKNYFIEGIFVEAETKNKNNRIYPMKVVRGEIARYNEEVVRRGRALGELDHPDGPEINLDRVSHKITELREDGNTIVGKAKILDTPMGKIVQSFIKEGIGFGVSTRALGSVINSNGIDVVQEDFHLCTVDVVHDPSAPKAFVNGLMENREWVWENGLLIERELTKIKKEILKTPAKNLKRVSIKALEQFLKSIK